MELRERINQTESNVNLFVKDFSDLLEQHEGYAGGEDHYHGNQNIIPQGGINTGDMDEDNYMYNTKPKGPSGAMKGSSMKASLNKGQVPQPQYQTMTKSNQIPHSKAGGHGQRNYQY